MGSPPESAVEYKLILPLYSLSCHRIPQWLVIKPRIFVVQLIMIQMFIQIVSEFPIGIPRIIPIPFDQMGLDERSMDGRERNGIENAIDPEPHPWACKLKRITYEA